jgi:IS5 family transposase
MDLTTLFCHIDAFWQAFQPFWEQQLRASGERQRQRRTQLSLSEIMTVVILFHQSGFRTFKTFYCHYVCPYLGDAFPELVSYNRFVELQSRAVVPLAAYLQTRYGKSRGIAFIDATSIAVCHNRRIASHRVFEDLAARGKTSIDWFYGFKVHLVVNDQGDLLAVAITPANRDDRKPVPKLTRGLVGKLFGDKGYISQRLYEELFERGLELITTLRRNMKPRLLPLADKLLLRKRALIESVNDQLKNISQIEHSRHRSVKNLFVNLLAGLIAYTWQPTKPALHFEDQDLALMIVC